MGLSEIVACNLRPKLPAHKVTRGVSEAFLRSSRQISYITDYIVTYNFISINSTPTHTKIYNLGHHYDINCKTARRSLNSKAKDIYLHWGEFEGNGVSLS